MPNNISDNGILTAYPATEADSSIGSVKVCVGGGGGGGGGRGLLVLAQLRILWHI